MEGHGSYRAVTDHRPLTPPRRDSLIARRTSDLEEPITMVKRDARALSPEALEELRRRAVAAVESGSSQAQVAHLLGVSRKTVGAWVRAYRRGGESALRPRPRGRRPGDQLALTPAQQAAMIKAIVAGAPDQYGLAHRLWNRQALVDLVHREHRVLLTPGTSGQYLARWGLVDEAYLKTMKQAQVTAVVPRRSRLFGEDQEWIPGADVLWLAWTRPHAPGPESTRRNLMTGFRDYFGDVHVLQVISTRGVVFFLARVGQFTPMQVERFVDALLGQFGSPLNLVVCRWPPQCGEILRSRPARHAGKVATRSVAD
ncbi:hypothetical protein GCM10009533_36110 [Saccharopolyspora spinosporotrichia]|nr:transcriptional regulator [Saccharopolyspora erythraea D]